MLNKPLFHINIIYNSAMTSECPKCGHIRQPTDAAPIWQCPGCGVAYNKVLPGHSALQTPHAETLSTHKRPPGKAPGRGAGIMIVLVILLGVFIVGYFSGQRSSLPQIELLSLECNRVNDILVSAVGEIKNISARPVSALIAQAEFRRPNGTVIDTTGTLIDIATLESGQRVSFKVSGRTFNENGTCQVFFTNPEGKVILHTSATVVHQMFPSALEKSSTISP